MDKEKEIQEMAINWCALREYGSCSCLADGEPCSTLGVCSGIERARELYNAGYRKADEVRKETAKEILQEVSAYLEYKEYVWFRELCGKYGVER